MSIENFPSLTSNADFTSPTTVGTEIDARYETEAINTKAGEDLDEDIVSYNNTRALLAGLTVNRPDNLTQVTRTTYTPPPVNNNDNNGGKKKPNTN